ncbi:GNAT family N-acetyltransferase [Solirubrobacter soli]|uniref:GNAT family N-acetyltransferase n=1 Tax=Solirubrobacter soli TaxID=363832 RepID=UPI00040E3CF5|nr:GNAT family N-acetyltransferase [Solirubrobacter soli]
MPIVGDIDRPERRTLVDENGRSVARYVHVERDGRPIADLLALDVPVERALPYITRELRGMRVAGSEDLGRALVAVGARLYRHSHAYTHDLVALPPLDSSHLLTPVDRPASELLPVYLTAFAVGHPDRMEADEAARHLDGVVAGKLGGLLPGSGLAIEDGRVVAAILIGTITDAPPPFGGPWIMEVFSTARGAGRALLARALHRTEGSLGLAVTEGNPAIAVYESLGFRRTFTAYTVDL